MYLCSRDGLSSILNPVVKEILSVLNIFIYLFIWLLTSLSTHFIGHIMMGSIMGRGNQYMQLVKVLYCKLMTNGKQLPAFPLEVRPGIKLRSQR